MAALMALKKVDYSATEMVVKLVDWMVDSLAAGMVVLKVVLMEH
jgi:hypothetical protein